MREMREREAKGGRKDKMWNFIEKEERKEGRK